MFIISANIILQHIEQYARCFDSGLATLKFFVGTCNIENLAINT